MSTKVYELAKELNISSKEMIEKLNKMGIEVKSHMNVVNDVNCIAVRNAMKNKAKPDETTIVKVEGKNKSESAPKKAAETKPVAKKDSANAEKRRISRIKSRIIISRMQSKKKETLKAKSL